MDTTINEYFKGAVESLLFVSEKPVTVEQLKDALQTADVAQIKQCLTELKQECETGKRGMVILEIAGGYQMLTAPAYVNFVRNFFKTKVKEKLSRPALETLAIVAYKQPVSRMDVEMIRGVNSDGVVAHLLNKNLIKIVGRKDVPGKPYLYGTTKIFLEYFGLKSLRDLPKLEDFPALVPPEQELADAPPEVQQAGLEDTLNNEANAEAKPATSQEQAVSDIPPMGENRIESALQEDTARDAAQVKDAPTDFKQAMEQVSEELSVREEELGQSYPRTPASDMENPLSAPEFTEEQE